jgi:ubiquinone/menaquinone biosynthesis C-methylase UbiE
MMAAMATPWDRAAAAYADAWVPRFTPYHADLIRELGLEVGDRVLVVSAGPGAEALAAARAVDLEGHVRATDRSEGMVRLCRERMEAAGFAETSVPPGHVRSEVADARDITGGPWDAVLCAFGLWQLDGDARQAALRAWQGSLADHGKVGLLAWATPGPGDLFEALFQAARELEPACVATSARPLAEPAAMAAMLETAGLAVVRHEAVRHPIGFATATAFVQAVKEGCVCRRLWEEIGDARMERVAEAFYAHVGGPDAPVSFAPVAALVIAARPGAERRAGRA